jgi:hypothetical protein
MTMYDGPMIAYSPDQARTDAGKFDDMGMGHSPGDKNAPGRTREGGRTNRRPGKTVKDRLKWPEMQVVGDWTASAYKSIRADEKAGRSTARVKLFQSALDQADEYEGTAYRGGRISASTAKEYMGADRMITLQADASASISRDISLDFAIDIGMAERDDGSIPVLYEFKVKTAADIRPIAYQAEQEQEVVLRQGTKYKITSWSFQREGDLGYYYIKGEEQ